jgi:hypothetical protein
MPTHRITRWHLRYHVLGGTQALATGIADRHRTRLDGLARGPVAEALAAALDQVFADDPAVYVIRRLRVDCTMQVAGAGGDTDLARRWAGRLARAIVRMVHQEHDSSNVQRFADEADHLAAFVRAVLAGCGEDAWYFEAFASHRRPSAAETLMNAFEVRPALVPSVLRILHRCGKMGDLLDRLGEPAVDSLWRRGPLREAVPPPDAVRPLFAAALRLLERLAGIPVPRTQAEPWFLQFLAEAPLVPWADGTQLVSGTLAALRFLVRQTRAVLSTDAQVRRAAVAAEPWLNAEDLLARLPGPTTEAAPPDPGAPPPAVVSHRLRDLLADLRAVLADLPRLRLPLAESGTALRWYAALLTRRPEWANDATVALTIQSLLGAAARLAKAAAPRQALQDLRRGHTPAIAQDPALATVLGMGDAATHVVEAMLARCDQLPVRGEASAEGVESACAGAFLLLRAVQDVRLAAVVRYAGYPTAGQPSPFAAFLVALLHRWAGSDGEELDPGPGLLFAEAPRRRAELAAAWEGATADDHRRALLVLGKLLFAQRLFDDPGELCLDWREESGTLVLTDREGLVPVWGRPAIGRSEIPRLVRDGLADWASVAGKVPRLLIPQELADLPWQENGQTPYSSSALSLPAGAAGGAGLGALAAGGLGRADVDLTLALYAAGLVRVWARWLRNLGGSSLPYLLQHFVRRPGRVCRDDEGFRIELEPRPLDVVLQLSDYLAPLASVPWLDGQRVRFALRGGR